MAESTFCKIGLHRWYLDSAYFVHDVKVCSRCEVPKDNEKWRRLEFERALWEEAEIRRYDFDKAYGYVFKSLYDIEK